MRLPAPQDVDGIHTTSHTVIGCDLSRVVLDLLSRTTATSSKVANALEAIA
ncbi:hypothetical protein [Acuticoccus kandeliae]|uniref:hypothetical protein n=1 Tax=Acuticoccus kandeliae TaxID=2073160 RepID=UPI001300B736|nr:hypothetical protein [Acuticoccus kandeliae]